MFYSKLLTKTYSKAVGKIFTWSPTNQVFRDEQNDTDYDYSSMLYFMHKGWLVKLPFVGEEFVNKYKLKEILNSKE